MKKQTRFLSVLTAAAFMTILPNAAALSAIPVVYGSEFGWTEEDGLRVYYDEDGYLTTDSWRKDGEDWYYLGEDGQITKNEKIDDYYVGSDGKMVKNEWIRLRNEEELDSPEAPAAHWYYFGKDGKASVSKWMRLNEKWYYFDGSGHMLTGKTVIDGSTYYLGEETDGAMKTGWLRLEDNASDPGASESWYYFNPDGKMVETQYDKKIDGNYYTFIDGKMQTGWVKMPELNREEAIPAATGSNAIDTEAASPSVSDYQYYGDAKDGKRAEGWRIIEGIPSIHDTDETATFYFRGGRAIHSAVKGNSLFTINSKKYAFNELGEMQTGRTLIHLENGEIANFCFGEDGAMKTGKQSLFNEDTGETENWYFYSDGERKGQGFHGIRDNVLYVYGKRSEASSGLRYAPAELNGTTYLVNTTGMVQKATSSSTSSEKPELGRGFKDFKDADGKIWVVDTNGIVR